MYTFYADDTQFTDKPFGKEVTLINKRFHEVKADYVTIAGNIKEEYLLQR